MKMTDPAVAVTMLTMGLFGSLALYDNEAPVLTVSVGFLAGVGLLSVFAEMMTLVMTLALGGSSLW